MHKTYIYKVNQPNKTITLKMNINKNLRDVTDEKVTINKVNTVP